MIIFLLNVLMCAFLVCWGEGILINAKDSFILAIGYMAIVLGVSFIIIYCGVYCVELDETIKDIRGIK